MRKLGYSIVVTFGLAVDESVCRDFLSIPACDNWYFHVTIYKPTPFFYVFFLSINPRNSSDGIIIVQPVSLIYPCLQIHTMFLTKKKSPEGHWRLPSRDSGLLYRERGASQWINLHGESASVAGVDIDRRPNVLKIMGMPIKWRAETAVLDVQLAYTNKPVDRDMAISFYQSCSFLCWEPGSVKT